MIRKAFLDSGPRDLPWHRRLAARVLLSVLLIAGGSLATVLYASDYLVTNYSLSRTEDDIFAASNSFRDLQRDYSDFAASQTHLIASQPVFRAYFTDPNLASDWATVSGMAEEYRSDLKADFCVVSDPTGRWLGATSVPGVSLQRRDLQPAVQIAGGGAVYSRVRAVGDRLYLVVSEPVRFDPEEVLCTLTFGYALNDALAQRLKHGASCDITFVYGQKVSGSSLKGGVRRMLQRILQDWPQMLGEAESPSKLQRLAGEWCVVRRFPLGDPADTGGLGYLVLLESWQPTQRFLDHVHTGLLLVALGILGFALLGSLVVSSRVTRPLLEIASTAREIANGRWERAVPLQGSADVMVMAESFNRMTANLRKSYTDTLEALSRALDARDNETEGHSLRVSVYALRLAERMGIDLETCTVLEIGALLHDIGKIGVPDAILRKPGALDPEERWEMQRHCEYGLRIVGGIPHLQQARTVIGYHHERYDGSGYPHGLKGAAIPVEARIFAVADTLDAITSDRPYRRARSFQEALEEIRRCSGSQFDPQVVETLSELIGELAAEHG